MSAAGSATQAEALGVEIYAGFPAAEVLYDEGGAVRGVATGDMGVAKDGSHKPDYQPGMELHAKYTLFAEGCRGSLSQELMRRFELREGVDRQKYGIGIKELWQVAPAKHKPGLVVHTLGWPLDARTGGGSFLYHLEDNLVAVGFVVHLDYENPYLSPFDEFQRFKTHPAIRDYLRGRQAPGVRRARDQRGRPAVDPQARLPRRRADRLRRRLPQRAAHQGQPQRDEDRHARRRKPRSPRSPAGPRARRARPPIREAFGESWASEDLHKVRNVKPRPEVGPVARHAARRRAHVAQRPGLGRAGRLDAAPPQGRSRDAQAGGADAAGSTYPKYDGVLTFDKLSSVFLSNTNHEENQPVHLQLRDPRFRSRVNLKIYDGPEQRYCPAGVYEFVADADGRAAQRLQINAPNCVHCKTCDIKDPPQNIHWVPPEGGGGPNYSSM